MPDKKYVCNFCNREFDHGRSYGGHVIRCPHNPNPAKSGDSTGKKHTADSKAKISIARLKYIKQYPGKCNFSRRVSKPEIFLGVKLQEWMFEYVTQWRGSWDRQFAVDYYLPLYNVCLEVNGAYKYVDGKFTPYYENRENIILATGVKVINIHCRDVYSLTISSLLSRLGN
jgi:hypothetical protein